MNLSRRSIVRALAAAPLIGSVMARAGVSGPISPELAGKAAPMGSLFGAAVAASATAPDKAYHANRIAELVKQIGGLGSERDRDVNERARQVVRLDADLAANRSMALHVRMRIKAERDVERDYASRRHWWEREIAELKESQGRFL